ncbi:MAG: TIGR00725 family protein [Actinobacteria bacterium]|uniref:Unannotated protein n=1 Tax=freshwater metagenome TaxID=449393 RepID=A0A6J6PKY6_9ZZZZ|nr:TIGR00725 family protein [Actinomycetota bacterium]
MRKTTIGVIGSSGEAPGSDGAAIMQVAHAIGVQVATVGAVLVSGGTTGVMAAASQGAHEAGGTTVGFLPDADYARASEHVDIAFPTGMGTIRNLLTARCCDAVIMVNGGVGTLNELTIAYDFGTPVIVVEGTGGWADRIRPVLIEDTWLDERRAVAITFAATAQDAVADAVRRAVEPRRGTSLPVYAGPAGR